MFRLSKDDQSQGAGLLNETFDISNGQVVEFSCTTGYNVQGPSNLRCYHGEWTGTSLPECVPAPCQLPQIANGQYLAGYRAGLTIANGSTVIFQCDSEYHKSPAQPVECVLGRLFPRSPTCRASADDSLEVNERGSPHYVGGTDIIIGGDITVLSEYASGQKPCGPPARCSISNFEAFSKGWILGCKALWCTKMGSRFWKTKATSLTEARWASNASKA